MNQFRNSKLYTYSIVKKKQIISHATLFQSNFLASFHLLKYFCNKNVTKIHQLRCFNATVSEKQKLNQYYCWKRSTRSRLPKFSEYIIFSFRPLPNSLAHRNSTKFIVWRLRLQIPSFVYRKITVKSDSLYLGNKLKSKTAIFNCQSLLQINSLSLQK